MPVIRETERLLLRTWELQDAPAALAIWGDPEVMQYVGPPIPDLDAAHRTLAHAAQAQERHGVSLWAVVEKASGEVVGACGFHFKAYGPEFELAYHFNRSHWGRNFATEAVRACLLHAVETLKATRIIASVSTENPASRRILQKVGFSYERLERFGDVDEELFSISL